MLAHVKGKVPLNPTHPGRLCYLETLPKVDGMFVVTQLDETDIKTLVNVMDDWRETLCAKGPRKPLNAEIRQQEVATRNKSAKDMDPCL